MMEKRPILRLSDELIGMIAAGEVVENPASAIKEMVENSLDAGATRVTVEIRDGGIAYMRVTDNGTGIPAGDIRMAFERHATSKLTSAPELFDLHTLGFRGEALASIAAVSKVTLTTRAQGAEEGVRAVCEGGSFREIVAAASPQGTTIVVRELFYNAPVRLRFLKRPNAEAVRVQDVLCRFILAHPDISFRLVSNGRQVYVSSGNGDLRSAIFSIYGRETAENVKPVHLAGGVAISGYVGVGDEARANRGRQTFIVNGRMIRSGLLSAALEAGCRERVTIGHYPICVLTLTMPPSMVDVNVHPNKLEVRFADERLVAEKVQQAVADCFTDNLIDNAPHIALDKEDRQEAAPAALRVLPTATEAEQSALREALRAPEPQPECEPEKTDKVPDKEPAQRPMQDAPFFQPYGLPFPQANTLRERPVPAAAAEQQTLAFAPYPSVAAAAREETPAAVPEAPWATNADWQKQGEFAGYRRVGVLFDTYILLENSKTLLLIDQHAAHERILYERLMREIDQGTGSQVLLIPQVIELTPQDAERVHTYEEAIRDAGFDFAPFGENAVQLRAVPNVLGEPEGKRGFLTLIDGLGELRMLSTRQKRRDAILQMACKHAIKGGDRLTEQEIDQLLRDLTRQDAPPTCPHGRPLVVTLSRQEIERRFKRINH